MALIQCPECGKEISDQAERCPNCGYQKLSSGKTKLQKKYIAIFGGCLAAVVIIIAVCFILMKPKVRSPFDKFSADMTKEEVHKQFGEPKSTSSEYNSEQYNNSSFVGLDGELSVWYSDDDDRISHVFWRYNLKDGEDISDFSEQIDEIKDFFTDNYGSPKELDDYLIWENSDEQGYTLAIKENAVGFLPAYISVKFEP